MLKSPGKLLFVNAKCFADRYLLCRRLYLQIQFDKYLHVSIFLDALCPKYTIIIFFSTSHNVVSKIELDFYGGWGVEDVFRPGYFFTRETVLPYII